MYVKYTYYCKIIHLSLGSESKTKITKEIEYIFNELLRKYYINCKFNILSCNYVDIVKMYVPKVRKCVIVVINIIYII